MPRKKATKEVLETNETAETPQQLTTDDRAVGFQTHCAKCGADLSLTGYVENNYKRFCGPACAA